MPNQHLLYFQVLKRKVAEQLQAAYPHIGGRMQDWRGEEIRLLQEDLVEKVQGRVSEKWFYTHLKPLTNEKLPRIDLLNLLCRYVGCENWQSFLAEQTQLQNFDSQLSPNPKSVGEIKNRFTHFFSTTRQFLQPTVAVLVAIVCFVGLLANGHRLIPKKEYAFCFVDADSGKAIEGQLIEVVILHEKESPTRLQGDAKGCVLLEGKMKKVRMVVQAAYYQKDTIVRILNKQKQKEEIRLRTDDYALMIHIFSTSKLEDWQKRRAQLNEMIAEEAQIVQVDSENRLGMEIYNKADFVNKLTMPVKSLKNIEVLQTEYNAKGEIVLMRFVQKQ